MTSSSTFFPPGGPRSTRVRGKGSDKAAQNNLLRSGGTKFEISQLDFHSFEFLPPGSPLECKDVRES